MRRGGLRLRLLSPVNVPYEFLQRNAMFLFEACVRTNLAGFLANIVNATEARYKFRASAGWEDRIWRGNNEYE